MQAVCEDIHVQLNVKSTANDSDLQHMRATEIIQLCKSHLTVIVVFSIEAQKYVNYVRLFKTCSVSTCSWSKT